MLLVVVKKINIFYLKFIDIKQKYIFNEYFLQIDFLETGAVFTIGRSRFADNVASHFFIRRDPVISISCGDEHSAVICRKLVTNRFFLITFVISFVLYMWI